MDTREELRRMRLKAKLTQPELAEVLGKSTFWVSRREVGTTPTSIDDFKEWAEACGFNAVVLVREAGRAVSDDAVEVSTLLSNAWDRLDGPAQNMLRAVIEAATR